MPPAGSTELAAAIALFAAAALFARFAVRTRAAVFSMRRTPVCMHCGYSGVGLVLTCPECGGYLRPLELGPAEHANDDDDVSASSRAGIAMIIFAAIVAAACVFARRAAESFVCITRNDAVVTITRADDTPHPRWLALNLTASGWRFGTPSGPVPAEHASMEIRLAGGETSHIDAERTSRGWTLTTARATHELLTTSDNARPLAESLRNARVSPDDDAGAALVSVVREHLLLLHANGGSVAPGHTPLLLATASAVNRVGAPTWADGALVALWTTCTLVGGYVILRRPRPLRRA